MAIRTALVIGGGIGGLSTAIALAQNGVETRVVERRRDALAGPGAVVVREPFLRAMGALGTLEPVCGAGFAYRGVRLLDAEGYVCEEIAGGPSAQTPYPGQLSLARPALTQILCARALSLGVDFKYAMSFEDIAQTPDEAVVTLSDGSRASYDLVVGADGKDSLVRHMMFGGAHRPRFTGVGVWRCDVPRPSKLDWAEIYMGRDNDRAGYVPITGTSMFVFAVTSEPDNPTFARDALADAFRSRLEGYGGLLAELRDEEISCASRVMYHPLEACLVPGPWYHGRVVLIGDAAHCVTSHLAQGATMAVGDAVALADSLERFPEIADALAAFMSARLDATTRSVAAGLPQAWPAAPRDAHGVSPPPSRN